MNAQRLLNVARALRESPNPEMFTMCEYGRSCGTPACALGHYAARQDLQNHLALVKKDKETFPVSYLSLAKKNYPISYHDRSVLDHFGIDQWQATKLFGSCGCGGAKTAEAAAEYIERFVLTRVLPA